MWPHPDYLGDERGADALSHHMFTGLPSMGWGRISMIVPELYEGERLWGGGDRGRSFLHSWMDMLSGARIKSSTYRVLMTMAQRFQSHQGHEYGFTVEQLAEVIGTSGDTVKRAWKEGRDTGWIQRVRQGRQLSSGEGVLSSYRLAIPHDAVWPSYGCATSEGGSPASEGGSPASEGGSPAPLDGQGSMTNPSMTNLSMHNAPSPWIPTKPSELESAKPCPWDLAREPIR